MLRLHRDSSRSYPGRPARLGVVFCDSARHGNTECDRAGVSRGHTRREETIPEENKSVPFFPNRRAAFSRVRLSVWLGQSISVQR